jgi:hypothetical protein
MRRTTITALCTALALLGPGLALASSAASSSAAAVIADCQAHSALTRSYTTPALQKALATMPATVREYTDCADVINTQLLKQLQTGGGGAGGDSGGSGSSFLPTPVIIVLVILVLAAVTFGAIEVRRRRAD